MSDLISRQAAIEAILECCPSDFDSEYECGYDDGLRQGVHRLKHLPSANAVPVKPGEWIHGREVSRDYVGDACVCIRYEKWWCSECNYTVDLGKPLWHYCPNCGACMTTKTPIDKDGLAY